MLGIRCRRIPFIFLVTMADDEIDLNPSSTAGEVPRKRTRPVDTPPESGFLQIRVYFVVLKAGEDTFTKSRYFREFSVPEGEKIVSSPDAESPFVSAGILHGIVLNFFGAAALATISKINSGDGDVTEHSLIGNSNTDYKVSSMITSITQFMIQHE